MHSRPPITLQIDAIAEESWKNGGGTTRLLAAGEGWRVSLATVLCDGPFSRYPGVRRDSVIVAGGGVQLSHGKEVVRLRPHVLATYSGAVLWNAHLEGAPAQVLNVMTEQDVADASVCIGQRLPFERAPGTLLVLPVRCSACWRSEPAGERLAWISEGSVMIARCPGFSLIESEPTTATGEDAYVVAIEVRRRGIITAASDQHQF